LQGSDRKGEEMREIKFRAWDKDNFKMLTYEDDGNDVGFFIDSLNKTISVIGLEDERRTDISVELMQYTGLKDKNDKEIYEGDIIALPNDKPFKDFICIVQFNDGCFDIVNKERGFRDYLKCWVCNNVAEVIGNIYENPELLKVD
jgi:uncharacterized phage protein (TIGR01671 family)